MLLIDENDSAILRIGGSIITRNHWRLLTVRDNSFTLELRDGLIITDYKGDCIDLFEGLRERLHIPFRDCGGGV